MPSVVSLVDKVSRANDQLMERDQDGEERFLYVEREGGYEKRKVQVGRTTETRAEITQGLKPGERVVTEGVFVLKSESKKSELKGDD